MRAFLFLLLSIAWSAAFSHETIAFEPHPGTQVPGDAAFREGKLDQYFDGAPVVLVLGYLGCTNLCGTTLTGVSEALGDTRLVPDRDYHALFLSIDPRDEKAKPERKPGWHFLTGAKAAARVAHAVGFNYRFEKESGQFAHPAGFVILTPKGKVSRYFEGVRFDSRELHDAIAGADQGETQSTFDRLVLVCFHDPLGARNTATVMMAIRIAMAALVAVAAFFAWRRLR